MLPGLWVGYYQYGAAYSLLGPLAALALWDVGTSVGNYMRPERVAPDSPSQGYLIDSLGIAYQGIYGLAMTGDSTARFGAGLMIPTLFALKYLTRSHTVNTADIANYRNRKVLRYAPANTLVREVDKFNGRLRLCSGFEVLHGAFNPSVVRFSGDHQQDNSALMSNVFPWPKPMSKPRTAK